MSEDESRTLQVSRSSYEVKSKIIRPIEQIQTSNSKLATVRRGPKPPEITQLIAEHRAQNGISNANNTKQNMYIQSDDDDDEHNMT